MPLLQVRSIENEGTEGHLFLVSCLRTPQVTNKNVISGFHIICLNKMHQPLLIYSMVCYSILKPKRKQLRGENALALHKIIFGYVFVQHPWGLHSIL